MSAREIVIRPRTGLIGLDLRELWNYRELFFILAWRDILVRYKQTAIGVAWALVQPILTMLVFTIIFGRVAKLPSNDAPYAVMTFAAILPWQFFANAMSQSSQSVVSSAAMVQKVYFPRLIIPVSATLSGIVDMLISLVLLSALMLWYGVPLQSGLLLLPGLMLLAIMAALGVGLWLAALNVRYRDVKYIVPFMVSFGMYISPVGYMTDVVPAEWQLWYHLNPMVSVIEGFRWAILGGSFEPWWPGFFLGVAVSLVLLMGGLMYFRNIERGFADVI